MRSFPFRDLAFINLTFGFGWLVLFGAGQCGDVWGQVVQLPSFHQSSYSGAVSVPDSGQASLGGFRSMRTGSSRSGVLPGAPAFGSRALGGQSNAGSMSVSATIIDLRAMDAALLKGADASAGRNIGIAKAPMINTLSPQLYPRGAGQASPHLEPNDWQIALAGAGAGAGSSSPAYATAEDDADVRYYMDKARQASDAGRVTAARVYYRMAYERLTPEQKDRMQSIKDKASEDRPKGGEVLAPRATAAAAGGAPKNSKKISF